MKKPLEEITINQSYFKKAKASHEKAMSTLSSTDPKSPEHGKAYRTAVNRARGLDRAGIKSSKQYAAKSNAGQSEKNSSDSANKTELQTNLKAAKKNFDPSYNTSDDYRYWKKHKETHDKIRDLESRLKKISEHYKNVEGEVIKEISQQKVSAYLKAVAPTVFDKGTPLKRLRGHRLAIQKKHGGAKVPASEENVQMITFKDYIIEASIHPHAIHITDGTGEHKGKYKVVAVGKSIEGRVNKGEHLTDTELDDASEMGAKIKHVKSTKD